MDISPEDMEKYKNLYDLNRQLIIKKNTLNLLLKGPGPQSESIRMVLNKIANEKIQVSDEQKAFIKMLQDHNYDINKIIDKHVQRMNEMMVKEKNDSSTEREAEVEGLREFSTQNLGTPVKSPSSARGSVDDFELPPTSSPVETASSGFTSAKAQQQEEVGVTSDGSTEQTKTDVGGY